MTRRRSGVARTVPNDLRRLEFQMQRTLTQPAMVKAASERIVEAMFATKVVSWPIEAPPKFKDAIDAAKWDKAQREHLELLFGIGNVTVAMGRVYALVADHGIRLDASKEVLDRHEPKLRQAEQRGKRAWSLKRVDPNTGAHAEVARIEESDAPFELEA